MATDSTVPEQHPGAFRVAGPDQGFDETNSAPKVLSKYCR